MCNVKVQLKAPVALFATQARPFLYHCPQRVFTGDVVQRPTVIDMNCVRTFNRAKEKCRLGIGDSTFVGVNADEKRVLIVEAP